MKGATRAQVFAAIDGERDYQDSRWNSSTTESGGRHSVAEFYLYIEHYVAAGRAALSTQGDPAAARSGLDILRKVITMGVACMEQNGVIPREGFERHVPDIDSLDLATVALTALARHGVPVDVQELLLIGSGGPVHVQPRALTTAIKAVIEAFWKKVSPVIADPDNPPLAVDLEVELRRLDVASSTRQEAMRRAYLVGRSVQAAIDGAAKAKAQLEAPAEDTENPMVALKAVIAAIIPDLRNGWMLRSRAGHATFYTPGYRLAVQQYVIIKALFPQFDGKLGFSSDDPGIPEDDH